MDKRSVYTRFWDDEIVSEFDLFTQHLFIYLLTSRYINHSGIFKLSIRRICFESKLSSEEFEIAKNILEETQRAFFYQGWVFVVNTFRYTKYWKSPKNILPHEREFEWIPQDVLEYFDTSIGSSIYSDQKTAIINHQQINKEDKEDNERENTSTKQKNMKMMTREDTKEMLNWAEELIN